MSYGRDRKRFLLGIAAGLVAIAVALVVVVLVLSGVSLASDPSALARVSVGSLGGTVQRIQAFGPDGHPVPLAIHDDRITPLRPLHPGEEVSVDVTVKRPAWLGWALGAHKTEHLTLRAPTAQVTAHWMTVPAGSVVRVRFDQPVRAVAYGDAGGLAHHALGGSRSSVALGAQPATGSILIAAAPRAWETVGKPTQVSWFPPSRSPVMATIPAAGSDIGPTTKLYLTFSEPVSQALGSARPQVTPATPGHWVEVNSHTLAFAPTGLGAPLASTLRVQLPQPVAVTSGGGGALTTTSQVQWTVPPGSTLRLQQLLAQAGYLPLDWRASGEEVPRNQRAEAQAAVEPPAGSFSWRYPDIPHQLVAMWAPGQYGAMTKGAIMKFENENGLTVDGEAGPSVWRALLIYALANRHLGSGYSYVYVHREVPETMTLWHDGHIVESSPANTGIAGAETELGTFEVFEHIPEGTMSGTNPDGSHYEDPGIKWISYFNGGDALHNFDRASFGTPQSLGCVELPLEAAAEEWPYTGIGTLVTIET